MKIEVEDGDTEIVINLDFNIECDDCGKNLRIRKEEHSSGTIYLKVDKCDKCCNTSFDDGYSQAEKDQSK